MATAMLMVLTYPSAISAEETGTNFFLKASKSVPRIGRRSEYDNFFLKASKNVPRIGRRREMSPIVSNGEALCGNANGTGHVSVAREVSVKQSVLVVRQRELETTSLNKV
jgi:hypothetical protein